MGCHASLPAAITSNLALQRVIPPATPILLLAQLQPHMLGPLRTCSGLRTSMWQWCRYSNMALRLAASSALQRSVKASTVVNTWSQHQCVQRSGRWDKRTREIVPTQHT